MIETLQPGHTFDGGEAEVPSHTNQRKIVREETVQTARCGEYEQIVRPSRSLVSGEQPEVSRIIVRVDKFGKGGCIA